jgi:anthranilate phosphoribosyltransferase
VHFHQALELIVSGQNLDAGSMRDVMREIMSGNTTDAQIGAFLVALRIKGESIDEITGAVEVMRELATGVEVSGDSLVDIVGTGGDESSLFNVSTGFSICRCRRRRAGRKTWKQVGQQQEWRRRCA